jgi:hypothetical protein
MDQIGPDQKYNALWLPDHLARQGHSPPNIQGFHQSVQGLIAIYALWSLRIRWLGCINTHTLGFGCVHSIVFAFSYYFPGCIITFEISQYVTTMLLIEDELKGLKGNGICTFTRTFGQGDFGLCRRRRLIQY